MNLPWPANPLLYEINARVWLRELAGGGAPLRLDRIPEDAILRLKEEGWNALWLMGVWAASPAGVRIARDHPGLREEYLRALPGLREEDVIGSPYAVGAYRAAPDLGGDEALLRLRERLAVHGLRLVLDFVPNHLARDHPWAAERPEVFVQGTEEDLARAPSDFFRGPEGRVLAHGRDPNFPGWSDTVQINYASPAARERMRGELVRIASLCDGVRCDMAMLLLPDVIERTWGGRLGPGPVQESFWPEAIAAVRALHPGFLFIAEAYWGREAELQEQGFDYTYDKWLYDRLRAGDPAAVRAHLGASVGYQRRCARFIENHDEERAARAFGGGRWLPAAAAAFGAPGLKLFHEGQLEGRKVRLPVQLARRPPEPPDPEIGEGYRRLVAFLREPLLRAGDFSLPEVRPAGPGGVSSGQVIALLWGPPAGSTLRQRALIAANLGGSPACARIPLSSALGAAAWVLEDRWDGSRYEREGGEMASPGLFVALKPHQVHLFEMRPAG
ncbi:MAG: hypothetical protein A3J27_12405 [Candidatus Tectomicrobia bacterium RIFCSPLOWO2_12_FULL_69_37]|nr:MAG: hypothetical protein A3J27_12405 [Candidatus Tectomicrobia bacterium RIFCSPLOWO2_12_FULL_69_37]